MLGQPAELGQLGGDPVPRAGLRGDVARARRVEHASRAEDRPGRHLGTERRPVRVGCERLVDGVGDRSPVALGVRLHERQHRGPVVVHPELVRRPSPHGDRRGGKGPPCHRVALEAPVVVVEVAVERPRANEWGGWHRDVGREQARAVDVDTGHLGDRGVVGLAQCFDVAVGRDARHHGDDVDVTPPPPVVQRRGTDDVQPVDQPGRALVVVAKPDEERIGDRSRELGDVVHRRKPARAVHGAAVTTGWSTAVIRRSRIAPCHGASDEREE